MRGGLESVVEELKRGASPSTGPPCVLRTHRQVSTSLRLGFSLLLTRERIKLLRPRADFNIKMEEDVSSVVDCMLTGIQYGKDARLLARVLTALQHSGYRPAEDAADMLFANLQQLLAPAVGVLTRLSAAGTSRRTEYRRSYLRRVLAEMNILVNNIDTICQEYCDAEDERRMTASS